MKHILSIFLLLSLVSSSFAQIIIDYNDPLANGKLILQVRNDEVKYICPEIMVEKGLMIPCDNQPVVSYNYFIKRDVIDSNWLNDVLRVYDEFIDVSGAEGKTPWLNFEKKASHSNKEDFTSKDQKTGITYRHHETRKHLIGYTIANPRKKVFNDEKKFQLHYDWEEMIKGKFESFYLDGLKRFRHKYEIHRIMSMDKNIEETRLASASDVRIVGSIDSYYPNGKKKTVVTYIDRLIAIKAEEDVERKVTKIVRNGVKSEYYKTGKLFSRGNFSLKGIGGKLEYFSPKGVVIKVENYKSGVLNGKVTEYYISGTIKSKGVYKNGQKIGDLVEFDEDGNKINVAE